jgi:NADPH:quinone reductase-like Zn-dependent oxidoreductase
MLSSSDAKLEIARKLGAKHGINYKAHPDWEKEVLKAVSPSYACFIDFAYLPALPFNLIYLLNTKSGFLCYLDWR